MAKLRKLFKFNVGDVDKVKTVLQEVERFCASGVAEGGAELTLVFEAPSLEPMRRVRKDAGEAPAESPKRKAPTGAAAGGDHVR